MCGVLELTTTPLGEVLNAIAVVFRLVYILFSQLNISRSIPLHTQQPSKISLTVSIKPSGCFVRPLADAQIGPTAVS